MTSRPCNCWHSLQYATIPKIQSSGDYFVKKNPQLELAASRPCWMKIGHHFKPYFSQILKHLRIFDLGYIDRKVDPARGHVQNGLYWDYGRVKGGSPQDVRNLYKF